MKALGLAAALLVSMGFPTKAAAQFCLASGDPSSCTIDGDIVLTAIGIIWLQMSSATTTLNAPTPSDFNAGFNSTVGPTLTVASNQSWTLNLRAASAVWSATNTSPGVSARVTKPASDLRWSTAVGGPFTPVSTSDVRVSTGAATGSASMILFFQTVYNWSLDTPGNYSLSLVLTLTAP